MEYSAYASYRPDRDENVSPVESVDFFKPRSVAKNISTSFVLVDPSNTTSKAGGKEARSGIRKHASKACAAQRLATIAEKKRSQNILSKRERQRQQAAERLDAALQQHAQKFAPIKEEYPNVRQEMPPTELTSTICKGSEAHSCAKVMANSDPDNIITRTDTSFHTRGRTKCSIPWILAPLSPSTSTDESDLVEATSKEQTPSNVAHPPPPKVVKMYSQRVDRLAYSLLNIEIDDRICFLLDSLFKSTFQLFDLRLPTKADKLLGRQNVWTTVYPQFVFTSEPLFWANVLGAGTIEALRHQQLPGLDPWNLKYRDLAISSVNRRLQTSEKDLVLDSGLISAIASLGVWERQCGSKDVWRAHCRGVETLSERLKENNQEDLVAAMITSCKSPGSGTWVDNHSKGFKRLRKHVLLDRNLVSSVCSCHEIALMSIDPSRFHALQIEGAEMLRYTTVNTINSRLRFPEGERINLEMHVLIQGAGVSMINFMAGSSELSPVNDIDLREMCGEAVALAKSVYCNPVYDELLLWSIFTICALNRFTEPDCLNVIARVCQRLQIGSWSSLEILLREFVCLATATSAYLEMWAAVSTRLTAELDCGQTVHLEEANVVKEPQ